MKRREFVTLLGGAAAWPLAARAQQAATGGLDPRVTPARPDLAAKSLVGVVEAQRFVDGEAYEINTALASLHKKPSSDAELMTQALKGERITVYDIGQDGWAWGQLAADGYVGYLPESALATPGPQPTHKVTALRTFAFPGPSIKLRPTLLLPFGSRLAIARSDGFFAITAAGGHVPLVHVAPVDAMENDFVAVAERFLGSPYLWGGKTSLGLDCSGLVQLALGACGIACPRDTDMQEKALGSALALPPVLDQLRRGDLLFWKGHVAIVRDAETMIHANAHHMATVIENTNDAVARIKAAGSDIVAIKRL